MKHPLFTATKGQRRSPALYCGRCGARAVPLQEEAVNEAALRFVEAEVAVLIAFTATGGGTAHDEAVHEAFQAKVAYIALTDRDVEAWGEDAAAAAAADDEIPF